MVCCFTPNQQQNAGSKCTGSQCMLLAILLAAALCLDTCHETSAVTMHQTSTSAMQNYKTIIVVYESDMRT